MSDFLSAPWWVGVQGIIATIAFIAAAIAAIDVLMRVKRDAKTGTMYNVKYTVTAAAPELVHVEVSVRALGNTKLFEAYWLLPDGVSEEGQPFPPVLSSSDGMVFIALTIPKDQLKTFCVGVAWLEPRALGTESHATRILIYNRVIETWTPYRWTKWFRKKSGKWSVKKSSLLSRIPRPAM